MESQHLCRKEITLQILHQKQFLLPILLYYFKAKILLTDPDLYHIDLSHGPCSKISGKSSETKESLVTTHQRIR